MRNNKEDKQLAHFLFILVLAGLGAGIMPDDPTEFSTELLVGVGLTMHALIATLQGLINLLLKD